MMNTKFLIGLLFLYCFGCTTKALKVEKVQIIPKPVYQEITGDIFTINKNTSLQIAEDFEKVGNYLKEFINKGTGHSLELNNKAAANVIILEKAFLGKNEEAYELIVTPKAIKIRATNNRGAFYGVQSLRQLLPVCFENESCGNKTVEVQGLTIKDAPDYKYRGMHLDVGRHFFTPVEIKKYIDMLAMLKMNTFHWHLTEDQGWRIEIKKYPLLTEIGAFRKETLIGHYNNQPHQFDGKRYGGYYTQEQIKDIVKYASDRQITIIPEIEMPGHSQAAIAAYPELGCTGEKVEVATKWGVFDQVYCPHEKTFAFLKDVLNEVMDLFPSEYIHIGGDEAPKTQWRNCNRCQQLIKKENLVDEHGLQSYFITKIEKYLNSKGRQIIGWDEILEGGLAPNATVMSWRGINGAVEAAKQGHEVVMTPNSHCYFDHYQSDNEDEPLAIGGFLPLKKVYEFNPIPEELSQEEAKYVLGAQGNVWTEYMPDFEKVSYMAFPRMMALSEVVWSGNKNKNYVDFVSRLENFFTRMDTLGINHANHLYEIKGTLIKHNDSLSYEFKTVIPDKIIRYAADDTPLNEKSPIYNSPVKIDRSMKLSAGVFEKGKLLGTVFTEKLNYHKAVGKKIELSVMPHEAYNAGGKEALINSINGSNTRYGDTEWLGFWGDDVEVLIDLEQKTPINSIKTRFFNAKGQWIYAPKLVEIYVYENDLEDAPLVNKIINEESETLLVNSATSFSDVSARYVKLIFKNYGTIPEGKQGEGNPAWLFIDELIIE